MIAAIHMSMSPPPAVITAVLKDARAELLDFRGVWKALLPVIVAGIDKTFDSQTGPLGQVWPELQPNSVRRKQRNGRGRSMLKFTERLFTRMASPTGGKRRLSKRKLVFGPPPSLAKRASVLHHGSPRRGIPARPFLGWRSDMRAAGVAIAEAHVRAVVARAEQRLALLGGR